MIAYFLQPAGSLPLSPCSEPTLSFACIVLIPIDAAPSSPSFTSTQGFHLQEIVLGSFQELRQPYPFQPI